jgi:hypothetical protein
MDNAVASEMDLLEIGHSLILETSNSPGQTPTTPLSGCCELSTRIYSSETRVMGQIIASEMDLLEIGHSLILEK